MSRLRLLSSALVSIALVAAPGLAAAKDAQRPGTTATGAGGAAAQTGADPSLTDYKLGIADHVRVTVYNEPDLSGEFTVNANGVLALPLIGDVSAAGDTTSQIVDKVQQKLAGGYLVDPHVSLEVLTYRPFYIMGEVNKPGEYPYSNGLTVLNAVAAAGGFTYRANKKKVFIRHPGTDTDQQQAIAPGMQIQPGDTIRIGERYF